MNLTLHRMDHSKILIVDSDQIDNILLKITDPQIKKYIQSNEGHQIRLDTLYLVRQLPMIENVKKKFSEVDLGRLLQQKGYQVF